MGDLRPLKRTFRGRNGDLAQPSGHGGIDARNDELTSQLTAHRQPPADARRLVAEWRYDASSGRYRVDGVDYRVRWSATSG